MYEMRAERATAIPESVLMWHALLPGGQGVALCGHVLSSDTLESTRSDEDAPTDRYCSSCLAAVGEALEAGRS